MATERRHRGTRRREKLVGPRNAACDLFIPSIYLVDNIVTTCKTLFFMNIYVGDQEEKALIDTGAYHSVMR